MHSDQTIACLDCGQEFTFTSGEQDFYAQRGFTEPPKRCPSCRAVRKAQRGRTQDGGSQGWSSGGNGGDSYGSSYASQSSGYGDAGSSYGGGYGGGSSGGYGERRSREMFDAVCADCGKTASVPFRPSGAKPVYCSDCFQNRR